MVKNTKGGNRHKKMASKRAESVYGQLTQENINLKNELDFYKSLFTTHSNSCVFNLSIKKKNGENIWVDHTRDTRSYLSSLDKDEEVENWLKPVKPSR